MSYKIISTLTLSEGYIALSDFMCSDLYLSLEILMLVKTQFKYSTLNFNGNLSNQPFLR